VKGRIESTTDFQKLEVCSAGHRYYPVHEFFNYTSEEFPPVSFPRTRSELVRSIGAGLAASYLLL
jgi:hypothetical protein